MCLPLRSGGWNSALAWGTKGTMSLFKAVLLGDSPLASRGSFSSGWPRLCVCARAQSGCTQKTTEEEKEPSPRNKVNATGYVTWDWLLGPYEVTGSLSTYDIYAHTLTNTLLALLTPISVVGPPRPAKSGPSICPGPTGVNVLFTICLLAPNFHLSDWPVWLELRPEAEVHG